jgi:tetratricopeptide (TPR) repeat protein
LKSLLLILIVLLGSTIPLCAQVRIPKEWEALDRQINYGYLQQALETLEEVPERRQDDPMYWYMRAKTMGAIASAQLDEPGYQYLEDPAAEFIKAVDQLPEDMDLVDILPFSKQVFRALYNKGVDAFNRGDRVAASLAFKQHMLLQLRMGEDDPESYRRPFIGYSKVSEPDSLLTLTRRLSSAGIVTNETASERLVSLFELEYDSLAFAWIEECLMDDRIGSNFLELANVLLFQHGTPTQRADLAAESMRRHPADVSFVLYLAMALDAAGDQDAAIDYMLQATRLDPDLFEARYNLGKLYYDQASALNMQRQNAKGEERDKLEAEFRAMLEESALQLKEAQRIKPGSSKTANLLLFVEQLLSPSESTEE